MIQSLKKTMSEFNFTADSFQGISHVENQDGFFIVSKQKYSLFFVFDGVSRSMHPKQGVENAIEFIKQNHPDYYHNNTYDLKGLMYGAHNHILFSGLENALTTYCAVCSVNKPDLIISNLGDSRIYVLDNHSIRSVTTDDTLYPGSNILTKCLGIMDLNENDFREATIRTGNKDFFLCSDGFYSIIEQNIKKFIGILKIKNTSKIKSLIQSLIEGLNFDDATYVLVKIKE